MASLKVFTGATLVTLDAAGSVIDGGELWVDGTRIVHAGAPGSFAAPEGVAVERIDVRDHVIMPGFANCHTHSYAALLKGSVDAMPLDLFMVNAILGAGARDERAVYLSAKISALEMMLTGTTACLDHFSHRPRHTADALDAVCQAYADAGVRAAVAPMFSDVPLRETLPLTAEDMPAELAASIPGTKADPDPFFEMMEAGLDRWKGHPLVSVMLGVDSPQRCTDALLDRGGRFCADHDIGNHTHLLEAKTQWAMADGRDSRGFVRFLADKGLAGPKSSFAHFVWFTDADLEAAAEAGVNAVHNPASNLLLGSGIQPLLRLVDRGVNVAFGSDGVNVGHMSMFEKTRLAALLPRVVEADPDKWLRAGTALRMATVNGAATLGRKGEAGTLEAGMLADFAVLDGRTVALSPRGDLPTQLLFNETGASVRDVYVNGVQVLENGKPTQFDAADTLGEAHEVAARLARDNRDAVARVEAFRPGLSAMAKRIVSADCGPCRIAQLT
ncbi:amidohydrolase family protein [Acuticoccus sp. MNP-M23]|uniref:amidohydrolase family protein n=1 Tax=Acuticoccus sp. MNP-M23 TaxID=3072793 RepID=UPI0028158782|nr:amidohydrolase family protein [Acuticoccus sp. MNP-M23]WMS44951.1 amidohydrolase family protein [Acuticoccus sp. MNP-M23]